MEDRTEFTLVDGMINIDGEILTREEVVNILQGHHHSTSSEISRADTLLVRTIKQAEEIKEQADTIEKQKYRIGKLSECIQDLAENDMKQHTDIITQEGTAQKQRDLIEKLSEEISCLEDSRTNQYADIVGKTITIKQQANTIRSLADRNNNSEGKIRDQKIKSDMDSVRIGTLLSRIDRLEKTQEGKDKEIKELKVKVSDRDSDIIKLKDHMARTVRTAEKEYACLDSSYNRASKLLIESDREVRELKEILMDCNLANESLKGYVVKQGEWGRDSYSSVVSVLNKTKEDLRASNKEVRELTTLRDSLTLKLLKTQKRLEESDRRGAEAILLLSDKEDIIRRKKTHIRNLKEIQVTDRKELRKSKEAFYELSVRQAELSLGRMLKNLGGTDK